MARPSVALLVLVLFLAGCTRSTPLAESADLAAFDAEDDPFLGDLQAPAQVLAWEAPGCPTCANFHFNQYPDVAAEFVETGKARFIHLQWSVGYEYDTLGSVALECMQLHGPDHYWDLLDFVLENQHQIGSDEIRQELRRTAADARLDEEALVGCYDAQATLGEVQEDIQAGLDAGGRGSPVFVILDSEGRVRGPLGVSALPSALRDATA